MFSPVGSSRTNPFPPEILEMVFEQVATKDLPFVLLASSAFYTIGLRYLYCHASCPDTTRKRVRLLQTLAYVSNSGKHPPRLPNPASAVRILHVDFHPNTISANLLRLVQQVLRELVNLRELQLEFSSIGNHSHVAWCLLGTSFRLERLHTSVALDKYFEAWINAENQSSIKELSLRGHQLCSTISLSPKALPNLTSFRSVHLDNSHNTSFLRGRPVESVAFTLFPLLRLKELDSLTMTSTPVKRLTALCLEDQCADILISEIAVRLRELESLHVVILSVPFNDTKLKSLSSSLGKFSALRYITFIAPDPPDARFTIEKERAVIHEWASACPTLKTVILPMGQVWYCERGKWQCYSDA